MAGQISETVSGITRCRDGRFEPAWTPATTFTFDSGVVVVCQERAGVLWVADED